MRIRSRTAGLLLAATAAAGLTSATQVAAGARDSFAVHAVPLTAVPDLTGDMQAQASQAKVVGLANAGLDTTNSIKQAAEFGIVQSGQKLAALLFTTAEVHGLGLKAAQGSITTEGYYWDLDDKSREFGNRYFKPVSYTHLTLPTN